MNMLEGKDSIMFLEAIECAGWSAKYSMQSRGLSSPFSQCTNFAYINNTENTPSHPYCHYCSV